MAGDLLVTRWPVPGRGVDRRTVARATALAQAAGYIVTGLWPILHMRSFEAVTGPKRDDWLVRTVGGLATAVGVGLAWPSHDDRAARPFGLAAATTFLAADLIGVGSGRLRRVYLLDAVGEAALIAAWLATAAWPRAHATPRLMVRVPVKPERRQDVASLRREVDDRLAEASRAAHLAWPDHQAPDPITEALHQLRELSEELAFAVEGQDIAQLRELAIAAAESAATVHEAADLVSS